MTEELQTYSWQNHGHGGLLFGYWNGIHWSYWGSTMGSNDSRCASTITLSVICCFTCSLPHSDTVYFFCTADLSYRIWVSNCVSFFSSLKKRNVYWAAFMFFSLSLTLYTSMKTVVSVGGWLGTHKKSEMNSWGSRWQTLSSGPPWQTVPLRDIQRMSSKILVVARTTRFIVRASRFPNSVPDMVEGNWFLHKRMLALPWHTKLLYNRGTV